MPSFATLVLYERHGHPAIGYRGETIDQIARGDVAEGTHGAWELRCWTPAGKLSSCGVSSDELVALVNAVFRTINRCTGNERPSDGIQRFQCNHVGAVVDIPGGLPLAEHLTIWSKSAASNDVLLQARHVGAEQFQAVGHGLQREIEAMAKVKNELFGRSQPAAGTEPGP